MNEIPKDPKVTQHADCSCQRSEWGMSHRHASALIALACFFMVAVFMGGYFLGKQHMIEHFVAKVEQDSFADQIYSSLCALYDQDDDGAEVEVSESESDDGLIAREAILPETSLVTPDVSSDTQMVMIEHESDIADSVAAPQSTKKYYAQLIGFGTKVAAEEFVKKQARKKRTLVIQAREGSTSRGRKSSWYQVVTEAFTDRDALANLVDRIAKEENIKGAQISAC